MKGKGKDKTAKSKSRLVANRAKERGLSREDAFTAYAMDRLLYRLGRSSQAKEFYLKGGLLIANLVDNPHRFTRDIDLMRSRGAADPGDLRERFREVVKLRADDGITFNRKDVRAVQADRDADGYDGVKVTITALVGQHPVDLQLDIGFGDALVPPASRRELEPFLLSDEPAKVFAYGTEPSLAEKIETLLAKFPAIAHRLKDVLDIVVLADTAEFDGASLAQSLHATLERRATAADEAVLDDMRSDLTGRRWETDWAAMKREKAVTTPIELTDAVAKLDAFVRPLLAAINGGVTPEKWPPGGPWT